MASGEGARSGRIANPCSLSAWLSITVSHRELARSYALKFQAAYYGDITQHLGGRDDAHATLTSSACSEIRFSASRPAGQGLTYSR